MTSWKTTAAGIAGILIGLGTAVKLALLGDYGGAVAAGTAVITAFGLLFARDNDKTSEDVGVK